MWLSGVAGKTCRKASMKYCGSPAPDKDRLHGREPTIRTIHRLAHPTCLQLWYDSGCNPQLESSRLVRTGEVMPADPAFVYSSLSTFHFPLSTHLKESP